MHIAVVNHSTLVTDADVAAMCRAVAYQMRYHIAPHWERSPGSVVMYASDDAVPPGAHTIGIFDDADQPGVLGWHTDDQSDAIYGRVFARPVIDNGGAALQGLLTISSVLSHEAIEMAIDPPVSLWADRGDGTLFAVEACDPVESASYSVVPGRVGPSVAVSDFVLPGWFDPEASGQQAYLSRVGPFQIDTGGYAIVRDVTGDHQVFGDGYLAWRLAGKQSLLARTAKRLAGQSPASTSTS